MELVGYEQGSGGTPGILEEAARLYGQGGQQYYPGQGVAGINDMQTAGIQGAIDAGNQAASYVPGMMDAASGAMGGLQAFAQGGGAQVGSQYTDMMSANDFNNIQGNFEVNPFVEGQADAFGQQAQRTLQQNILPSTVSNALGAGQMGSSRHGIAQGLATANLGQTLQEQLANLNTTAWQNAAQNQLTSRGQTLSALGTDRARGTNAAIANAANETSAWGMLPGMVDAYGNAASTAANIGQIAPAAQMAGGAIYQQNAQDQINAERDRWNFYQAEPWNNLDRYASIVTGAPNYGSGATASYTNPYAAGMLGAGTGLNAGSMLGDLTAGTSSSGGGWGGSSGLGSGAGAGGSSFTW